MRKSNKPKRRADAARKKQIADGSIVEEAPDEDDLGIKQEDDESSVDSLMAESPGKYGKRNISKGDLIAG